MRFDFHVNIGQQCALHWPHYHCLCTDW